MIPELRAALNTYLTSGGNGFITALGDNLFHKHPISDQDYPFCVFTEETNSRAIDSGDKLIRTRITFRVYDGSDDGAKESYIYPDRAETIIDELDKLLDLATLTVDNYTFNLVKRIETKEIPTENNSVHGIKSTYEFHLQKSR